MSGGFRMLFMDLVKDHVTWNCLFSTDVLEPFFPIVRALALLLHKDGFAVRKALLLDKICC